MGRFRVVIEDEDWDGASVLETIVPGDGAPSPAQVEMILNRMRSTHPKAEYELIGAGNNYMGGGERHLVGMGRASDFGDFPQVTRAFVEMPMPKKWRVEPVD